MSDLKELERLVWDDLMGRKGRKRQAPTEEEMWGDETCPDGPRPREDAGQRRRSRPPRRRQVPAEEEMWGDEACPDDFRPREDADQRRRSRPSKRRQAPPSDDFEHESDVRADRGRRFKKKTARPARFGKKMRAEEESPSPAPELELDLTRKEKSLFSEEEERFIRETAEWLRPRENKDIIISRIWEMLTGSEPQRFYSPETEALPEGGDAEGVGDEGDGERVSEGGMAGARLWHTSRFTRTR
ncbi:hypothetical protein DENIS_1374 [Desulfonema ishimotonii]|uniref:Uncharacterized protein n=1 Tax=Desulfonema ishimotonii TaxID=45657 RepID=A0A401FTW8_9BACT|nr:hypothetical protein [Desulfonema ishimotonii]GBC60422.1 hypothetical protein DENIS_1374 [Desulfonema ishimotonii]